VPQIAAAGTINKLLEAGKFDELYRDWCHPHLQKQFDKEDFAGSMKEDFGKGVIKLFSNAIKAIDESLPSSRRPRMNMSSFSPK